MINLDFKNKNEVLAAFASEGQCIVHLETLRWDNVPVSPFDPFSKVYKCKDNYRCRNTGKYFNVKTATIFHNTKIDLRKWFVAIWLFTQNDRITSVRLAEELNLTQKSAWYMLQKIKKYFEEGNAPIFEKANPENIESSESVPLQHESKLQLSEWLKLLKK